ncbi:MAG: DUF4340 domain-containing protein [Pirellulales bacterium]
MTESSKSLIAILGGVVLMLAGLYFLPTPPVFQTDDMVNKVLFPDLKDGNVSRSMEIVDGTTLVDDKPVRFEVKQANDQWVLPSHNEYPADAKQQLVDASQALVGVKAIGAEQDANHELYGVLDPTEDNKDKSPRGVGKLVVFRDAQNKPIARLIVGKALKEVGRDEKDADVRFVRIQGQDPVYTAKLPEDKFSPKFEDWIERDLLKLSAFEINHVELLDSTIDIARSLQGLYIVDLPRQDIQLAFDDKKNEWSLEKMLVYDDQGTNPREVKPGEGEELDSVKLNQLKEALHAVEDRRRQPQAGSVDPLAARERVRAGSSHRDLAATDGLLHGPRR